ncbi:hypothetical protein DPMN_148477 [Dreissena polymorpha]|uniref:Uncharacterized protein n=1 Tax=Dreissena polymorpha TaxID=45954 RepID=A0A9D4FE57_DREPO|nr:hypothetical protein DPMN_148477 [Dreissena polymorpha]
MPQTRGSCGHIRAAWDNHGSCLSCAGCTQDNCCPFCEHWSADTWAIKCRPFKSRGRNKNSSDQSRESSVCRDFSPHNLDHMPPVAARHRSLPHDYTGQNLPGPFIGNDQLTGPETSPVTGHAMTGQPVTDRSGHRSCFDRSGQPVIDRSGHRSCNDRSGHRVPVCATDCSGHRRC